METSTGQRAPGTATSLERIDWIIGLDADPVRRNLLITRCYHDLSTELARQLHGEDANWCTFVRGVHKLYRGR